MTNLDQGRVSDFDIDGMIRQADLSPFPLLLANALAELKALRLSHAALLDDLRKLAERLEREANRTRGPHSYQNQGRVATLDLCAADIRRIVEASP